MKRREITASRAVRRRPSRREPGGSRSDMSRVAINYDPESVRCPIAVSGRVAKVYKGEVADGQVVLPANDVAIFEVR
jgi:hypothetical protein